MPAPVDCCRFIIRGKIQGSQSWSIGWWSTTTPVSGAIGASHLTALADTLSAGAVGTFLDSLKSAWDSGITATQLDVHEYAPGANQVSAIGSKVFASAKQGSGTATLPYFVSAVASFRTTFPGRHQRGRMYMPVTIPGALSAGQFSTTLTGNLANYVKTMFDTMNAADWTAYNIASGHVMSAISFTRQVDAPLIRLEVNTLPDTQHRRIDKTAATATSVATLA